MPTSTWSAGASAIDCSAVQSAPPYAGPMPCRALSRFVDTLPAEGSFSVWCAPLGGDPEVAHEEHRHHYAASTMKLALVLAAYRLADLDRLDLDQPVRVHNDFTAAAGSARFSMDRADDSDPGPWRRMGSQVALRWLCYRAIVRSSNLATNLVLERIGVDAVAAALRHVGATNSVVARGIEDASAREAGLENLVTAADLGVTLQALGAGTAASPAACREILAVLGAQRINDAIPARLPPDAVVLHKSGWVTGISHDAGIISAPDCEPFVFVMCTTSELDERTGLEVIAAGAAAAYEDRRVQQ